MLNPKTNVCKLRNGVLLSLFARFQDDRQNHTESYIVVDSLFDVPRNICGGSVLVLFYYASICVLSIFVNTLTRKRMIVALLYLSSWCLVTVSVLFLFLKMPWVDLQ